MKTFIYFITILLLASACKKITNSNDPVTIEGILMASCDVPAANKSGFIITDDGLLSGPGISLSFTTDENGYFKITHTGKESVDKFTVRVQGSSDVLRVTNLSGNTKNLGKVYINPFPTNFIIKMDVKNPYTDSDTLVIKDFSSATPLAQRKIAGPFTSGVLETVNNHMFNLFPLNWSQTTGNSTPEYAVMFYMLSDAGNISRVDFSIAPICSGDFAEVTLVID